MTSHNKQVMLLVRDTDLQRKLRELLADYEVITANTRATGLALIRRYSLDIVLFDLELSGKPNAVNEGLVLLEEIRSLSPNSKILVLTSSANRKTAIEAISAGAQDVFLSPVNLSTLKLAVERAVLVRALERDSSSQSDKQDVQLPLAGVGSPKMERLILIVRRVAPTDIPIILTGEPGTGKELLAQAIHRLSARSGERFVSINCAAIPESRIELELFGGSNENGKTLIERKIGDIERADKGTLFLNNITALSPLMQEKLLRFLWLRKFYRAGEYTEVPADIRVVAASSSNLKQMVENKKFNEQLYMQLNGVSIQVPSLRERTGDAILMAQFYLKQCSEEFKLARKHFSSDAINAIETYDWPGNLREMESKIRHALIMSTGKTITADDLEIMPCLDHDIGFPTLKEAREEGERQVLLRALAETESNISDAANLLGVARPTVYKLIEKFRIQL